MRPGNSRPDCMKTKLSSAFRLPPLAFAFLAAFVLLATALRAPAQPGWGTALQFDGVDDLVRIADFGLAMPTNEVTVEFWLKVETVQNQVAFALEPNQDTNRFLAHVPFADGGVYWDFGNWNAGGNGGGRLSYTPPVATTNAWHHWTFVASQSANAMCIYRNGMLETNKTGSQVFTPGAYDLLLGGLSTFCTGGQMDEFRIWNVAAARRRFRMGCAIR